MTASIAEFLTRRKRDVDKLVDQTFFRLLEDTSGLLRIMPRTSYQNRKLLALRFKHNRPTIASVIAPEQEIPASRPRMDLTEDFYTNCKVGKQIVWKEQDFELVNDLQNLMLGTGGTQAVDAIERHYFGQVADLVPAIYDRSLTIGLQILTTGTCNFVDPLSGATFALTYSDLESTLFPAALAGNARWQQATTCTPLDNLENLADAYYDKNGSYAPFVVMSLKNFREIRNSNSAKIAVLRRAGADSATPDTTGVYIEDPQAIDLILQRTRAREVIIFDAEYSQENADGSVDTLRYMPQDYVVLTSESVLEQAFVPTVENNFAPGIFNLSEIVNRAPRVERSVAVGNMIPACFDRRKLCARKVN